MNYITHTLLMNHNLWWVTDLESERTINIVRLDI